MALIYEKVGGRDLHDFIAHMPGVVMAVNEKAQEGKAIAEGILAKHRDSGQDMIDDVSIGITDSYIELVSPKGIAHIIEYGRAGYVTKKAQRVGDRIVPAGTAIAAWPGTHVLRKTYEAM